MDKLRENGFAVTVTVLILGLLVFIWMWPVSNAMNISEVRSELESTETSLQRFIDKKEKPTDELLEYREGFKDRLQAALDEAVGFYAEKHRRFHETYLDGAMRGMDSGQFKAIRQSAVQKLKESYVEKFPRPENPDNPHADGHWPFTIEEMDVMDEATVALAQKQYWMIESVFQNLEALKVGGLNSIKFRKPSSKSDLPTPSSYSPIRMVVDVNMELSKLEPLLVGLLASEQVPYIDAETISVTRLPESSIPKPVVEKKYPKIQEAQADQSNVAAAPEPKVSVILTLTAMSWNGIAQGEETTEGKE